MSMTIKKAVVLLSGGMDSATCLAIAKSEGYDCYALSFNYGQKQIAELAAAKKIAANFDTAHQIIDISSLSKIARSALTQQDLAIPDFEQRSEVPITYVPARNTIMISFALSYAESLEAECIFIGASAIDYSGYPDCRPEYFTKFEELIALATKAGINGQVIRIKTPLIALSKAQTIEAGIKLGIDYRDTITCYRADNSGKACGTCDSCHLRKKGFLDLGIDDQTLYA